VTSVKRRPPPPDISRALSFGCIRYDVPSRRGARATERACGPPAARRRPGLGGRRAALSERGARFERTRGTCRFGCVPFVARHIQPPEV
jgi:hypothetical protein